MCDWCGEWSTAMGVGCVGALLVSDSEGDAAVFVVGVDKVIEALVDLGIGEVGGEYGHDMTSVGDRVCNGLVGFTCVPLSRTEGG